MSKKASLKERLAAKSKEIKDKSKGFQYLVIKEGTTRMRILRAGEEEDWSVEATTFFLGMDIGLVISPHTFGGKCALMNAHNELASSKDEKERALAKRLKPGRKFFMPAIRYNDLKGEEIDMQTGPKLLMLTPGVTEELIQLYLDEDEAGDFTDPVNGYDLKFSRTGKGKMDTEYSVRACKPTKLKDRELAKKTFDPVAMLKEITADYKTTKEKLDQFLNLPPEEDEVKSDKKKSLKKKKRKSDV